MILDLSEAQYSRTWAEESGFFPAECQCRSTIRQGLQHSAYLSEVPRVKMRRVNRRRVGHTSFGSLVEFLGSRTNLLREQSLVPRLSIIAGCSQQFLNNYLWWKIWMQMLHSEILINCTLKLLIEHEHWSARINLNFILNQEYDDQCFD